MRHQPPPALDHQHRDLAAAIDAITACDPADLATALYDAGVDTITRIAAATQDAAHHAAYYPRHSVIAEADALLYDVLRWPITDIAPDFPDNVDLDVFARHRSITTAKAQTIVDHLVATERDGADMLLASGVLPMYTPGQAQAFTAMCELLAGGTTPTRASVRERAMHLSRAALRPDQGTQPMIYPRDGRLRARVVSNNAAVEAILWLDRMEAHSPPAGSIAVRIEYLADAQRMAAAASSAADRAGACALPVPVVVADTANRDGLLASPSVGSRA